MDEQIIYGRNAVAEALRAGKTVDSVYLLRGARLGGIAAAAKESGAVVKEAGEEKLRALTGTEKHGGVAAVLCAAEYAELEELFAVAQARGEPPFFLLADEIQDPHNLGAILRTAEAAGAHGVILPKRRSVGLTAAVFKTSAGAASWMKVARVANLTDTIRALKKRGLWVYGAEADGEPFYKANLGGPIALVIGSEGNGLGRLVRESCDAVLSIDMYGRINSLNASVSAGILMYEIVRHRRKS